MPSVSIIIPAYNNERTIQRTIESVLKQPCRDYEIILIDDGSQDRTLEICEQYAQQYPFIHVFHQENSGVSAARNKGLDRATGDYVAFLDADDLWADRYYDESLATQFADGFADLLIYSTAFADAGCVIVEEVHVKNETLSGGDSAVSKFYHTFCAFFVKREFIGNNHLRFSADLRYGEDELMRSQCLYLAHEICAFDKIGYIYINNPYSSTKLKRNNALYAQQKLQVYYKMKDFFFTQYRKHNKREEINNTIMATYLCEAIRLLSETGYGYRQVAEIAEAEGLAHLYYERSELLNPTSKTICMEFFNNSYSFYIRRRFYGLWYYTAVDIKHMLRHTLFRFSK